MSNEVLANGRYVVSRRLAAGGMGEVLLADFVGDNDVTPGLLVVKRILEAAPGVPPAEGQVRMLLEEGRLGLRLQHENLVETFRIEQDGQTPLLVIELLAGKSMAQVLGQAKKRQEHIPVDVALQILRGACCGLHFAHTLKGPDGSALGLVHRDVSPANIFVTFDGKVKVIDFGVAKSEDSEVKTATGILKGKLGYMSPEQSFGVAKLTPQADIWSLGVFFWELLIAERLFSSPNPTATLLQISQKDIAVPSTLRADVPRAVDQLAMTMLSRPLESRFRTCADVVRAIDAILGPVSIDVGRFLAERFPEEAVAGTAEAEGCARRARRGTVPTGLVDGSVGVDPADDDDLATAILPSALRQQLLRESQKLPPAPPARVVDDIDDDAATVRVDSDILAQVRALGRTPGPPPRMVDDDEDIATRRVDPEVMAAARMPLPRSLTPGPQSRPQFAPPRPPAGVTSDLPVPRAPLSPTLSPALSGPPSLSPPMRAATTTGSVRPAPPSSTTTGSNRTQRPATSVPTTPRELPRTTSWVGVAAATFGGLAVVMGIGVSFAIPTPAPRSFVAYADPAGYDVVVADVAHVPPGRPSRPVDPAAASLLRSGDLEPQQVSGSLLETRLRETGVWSRAALPTSSKGHLAALLPLIIVALGALALALAVPAIVRGPSTARTGLQAALVVVVLAIVGGIVQVGGLAWPGRAAYDARPRLEWR